MSYLIIHSFYHQGGVGTRDYTMTTLTIHAQRPTNTTPHIPVDSEAALVLILGARRPHVAGLGEELHARESVLEGQKGLAALGLEVIAGLEAAGALEAPVLRQAIPVLRGPVVPRVIALQLGVKSPGVCIVVVCVYQRTT